jgi:aminopeptidase N
MRLTTSLLASTALLAIVAGCPAGPPAVAPPAKPAAKTTPFPEARPDGRLPSLATPIAYDLAFVVDPTTPRFSGTARIEVELPSDTSFLVLHGRDLRVTTARVEFATTSAPAIASVSTRPTRDGTAPEEIVLAFSAPLPTGRAHVVVEYDAPFGESLSGLYRSEDHGAWYAFTKFEPTDARRAFPSFDEPSFKVPFAVTIDVPKGLIAVANSPESTREELGERTRFRFARTPPLPTYLMAFAVGDFDIRELTRFTKPPVRLVTAKGKAGLGGLALETTGALVDELAKWFDIPYPYDKLDIVAVPDFQSGAMENAGLITFREERLLLDPERASLQARRSQALIIAHELAHQWFGDLVTASWWNDLWLNEGMATWMTTRIIDRWQPSFGARIDAVTAMQGAMDVDGLATARAVRQPVVSSANAREAFDGITYEKGAAVLSTIEAWIGEIAFQRGIRDYLRENAWKSVQADRLFAALDRASGKDVSQMASSYLDKTGVPEVSAHLECDPRGLWHAELGAQPWRPLGSKLPETTDLAWTIPACVRAQGAKKDACADLVAGAPSLVAGQGGCPAFVHPNAPSSYYRFVLPEKDFLKLAENRSALDVPARVTLLANAWAAVRSGQLEAKALLKLLPLFDDEKARQVVDQIVTVLASMSDTIVDEGARPAFRTFSLGRLAKRKKSLGWAPPPKGDASSDEALARGSILAAMGDVVEDETTLREAEDIATKWLVDPASVNADTAGVAVSLASRHAGAARVGELREAAKRAKTREDRIVALRALAGFDDPKRLEEALDATLSDEVRPNEVRYVFASAFGRRKSRPIAEAWVRRNWDALRAKLPGPISAVLVQAAGVGCSTAEGDERAEFYGPRVAPIEGTARAYAGALESISLCAALREKGAPVLTKALSGAK